MQTDTDTHTDVDRYFFTPLDPLSIHDMLYSKQIYLKSPVVTPQTVVLVEVLPVYIDKLCACGTRADIDNIDRGVERFAAVVPSPWSDALTHSC